MFPPQIIENIDVSKVGRRLIAFDDNDDDIDVDDTLEEYNDVPNYDPEDTYSISKGNVSKSDNEEE